MECTLMACNIRALCEQIRDGHGRGGGGRGVSWCPAFALDLSCLVPLKDLNTSLKKRKKLR